ncbi:MAG: OmpA family protein [Rubellimicrobium sp.]|nr:OmpA family protein [Rubellimicrobium sp.]
MTLSRLSLATAAVALVGLAACEAPLPGQGTQNTQQAAAVGAGLGAIIGIATGSTPQERAQNAAIGAVLGGGLGAIAGSNLDRQEAELRSQLPANVGIVNTGSQLVVTVPQDLLFAVDSATVSGSQRANLQTVAASLNRYPDTTINVIGHTDNTGAAGYNQQLSEQRANAVASVLIGAGVAPARIRAIGRGEDQPVSSNLTAEGRQQNRRVEIIITPRA